MPSSERDPATDELVAEFIQVSERESDIGVLVREIHWHGSHAPYSEWEEALVLPKDAGPAEIEVAVLAVLEDSRYFAVCAECGKRQPVGWMDEPELCQSCNERNDGVVH